jgi:hypothetical protein
VAMSSPANATRVHPCTHANTKAKQYEPCSVCDPPKEAVGAIRGIALECLHARKTLVRPVHGSRAAEGRSAPRPVRGVRAVHLRVRPQLRPEAQE